MKLLAKSTTAALLGATLSACGGQSIEQETLTRAEQYDAMSSRVFAMTATGPLKVEATTGSASFSGYAGIVAGSDYDATILVGDADVNVNFNGNGSVSGAITNISGAAGVNTYVTGTGTIDAYSGNIAISNGSVGSGNSMSANYSGTLRGNGDTLVVGGVMDGQFYGNPTIRALELNGLDPATLNGGSTYAGVFVTAERD